MASVRVLDRDLDPESLELYLQSEVLAIDTEAMGLLPRRDRLCLVQICDSADQTCLVRLPPGTTSAPNLKLLLEAEYIVKIFHYARFDLAMLRTHLGIETRNVFCSKIASKLARTYTDRHGLKELVRELEQVELDKTVQSSDWGNVHELAPEQLSYAANDVRYLISIRTKLIAMLEREGRYQLALDCFKHLSTLVTLDLLGYGDVFAHSA
ncbi:MAG: ribonuclease D [Pseudanabaenaceae cyanobacterium bins.68]|nr:ribonuclease D [Pseudanabaenaceae cyanobacterium bins.68]